MFSVLPRKTITSIVVLSFLILVYLKAATKINNSNFKKLHHSNITGRNRKVMSYHRNIYNIQKMDRKPVEQSFTNSHLSLLVKRETTLRTIVPEDLMAMGPFNFLPNYRNPCWRDATSNDSLNCVPYFYVIGAPKCGTTDLFRRLTKHPEISCCVVKEPHWLTRKRFYDYNFFRAQPNFSQYLEYFRSAIMHIRTNSDVNGFHKMVFGDFSASTMWDNDYWPILPESENLSEPLYTNADYIHHINPNAMIIAMLRNPVDRLYSDYLYFTYRENKSPHTFHLEVKKAISIIKSCLKSNSLRQCAYVSPPHSNATEVRLRIGIYHLHLKEFLRVFLRRQLLVIKLEDYSKDMTFHLKKIFSFLDISPLSEFKLRLLSDQNKKANTRRMKDRQCGNMLPETRKLLQDFYQQHNDMLAELIGENFNYNDDVA